MFEDVVNQEHIKKTLQNELISGSIAHAYLFAGPRGIGKTSLARIFAKALNCQKRDIKSGEPCSNCATCKSFSEGLLLDVIEIDAASHTGVDTVREVIIDTARLLPSLGAYKVFIIDEVHMLSTSAFNALLKIIEEPPEHVVFIFATTESIKVPATIVSRCQRFDFKKITNEHIITRLMKILKHEKRSAEKEVLETIARFSDGALRDAESLLGQILTLATEKITMSEASLLLPVSHVDKVRALASLIIAKNTAQAIDMVTKLSEDGIDLDQLAKDLLELWRLALLKKIDASISINDKETEGWLEKELAGSSIVDIQKYIEHVINAIKESENEWIIPTLPLEVSIVRSTT